MNANYINNHYSRRNFIYDLSLNAGYGVLAAAGLTAAGSCGNSNEKRTQKSEGQKNQDKLGVALVGLGGYSSGELAPSLQETSHCYLAGIVTGTPEKAVKWKKQYNIPDNNIYDYRNFDSI